MQAKKEEEMDMTQQMFALWAQPFLPNLMNSLFSWWKLLKLLRYSCKLQGTTLMIGMTENHPLFLSIFACIAGVGACAWQVRLKLTS